MWLLVKAPAANLNSDLIGLSLHQVQKGDEIINQCLVHTFASNYFSEW